MKIIHLADLHIGKRVNEFPMLEDQRHILDQIVAIIEAEQPHCTVIAGDVYDKAVPSAEAVEVLDDFLVRLAALGRPVLVLSGNHDSAERMAFGGRLMQGVHMAPVYTGAVAPITIEDEHGPVDFFLLPFVRPMHVRQAFPQAEIHSANDAVATALGAMVLDSTRRSVLVTHQFVTGAVVSGSEEMGVGGVDSIEAALFDAFDYVALGHLHKSQAVGRQAVRYSGSPLKYSFAEAEHVKTLTVARLDAEGGLSVDQRPLIPRRDMRQLQGSFEAICREAQADTRREDYLRVVLTDEAEQPGALGYLRDTFYPNIMQLAYDNTRTRHQAALPAFEHTRALSPMALFAEFFKDQNGVEMSGTQRELMAQIIAEIWEEGATS